jgi:hypothetical protein
MIPELGPEMVNVDKWWENGGKMVGKCLEIAC